MASPTSAEAIQRLLADPKLSARQKSRIISQANAQGIKVSAHLGAPTPEVIAQLQKSLSQQKFAPKQKELQSQITELSARGIVLGNSSTRPELSKQTAAQTFALQQASTRLLSGQVAKTLESQEFKQIRERGAKVGALNDLLNKQGIAFPKYQTEIINELAQTSIQGRQQTAENISRILDRSGIANVPVSVVETPTGIRLDTGSASQELLAPLQNLVNDVFSGTPEVPIEGGGVGIIGGGAPAPEEATGGGLGEMLSRILSNPLTWIVVIIGAVAYLALTGAPMKRKVLASA